MALQHPFARSGRGRARGLYGFCVLVAAASVAGGAPHAAGQAARAIIQVDASRIENRITRWMTGACIEDVNHEIYGGLYAQKLYGESFEEPPPSPEFDLWNRYGGSWRQEGKSVHVDAMAGAKLVSESPEFADGAAQAEVRVEEGGDNAGLIVRTAGAGIGIDNFDGYEVSIRANAHRVILGRHHHNFQLLADVPAPVSPRRWHRLRVLLAGERIRVYLDRETDARIDYVDRADPLLRGTVALRTWNSSASFRSVRTETAAGAAEIPFRSRFSPQTAVSGMWQPTTIGAVNYGFAREGGACNGAWCQRVTHRKGPGIVGVVNRGLNRWGIAVVKGEPLAGRVYLRGRGLLGPVTVALQSLDGRRVYASQRLSGVTARWKKFAFTLTSPASDPGACFRVSIDKPGSLWIDQAVLTGTGRALYHGLPIRADIGAGLVSEGLTFLRYAGTMVNVPGYRWKSMIGNPDRRPPYAGNWYPYATNGFGIFDFLNFCERAGMQSAFAINIEETVQDAADLADYLTAPASTKWGAKRAADGHAAPYHVRYLEIGNEEAIGTDTAEAYAHYADRFRILARAIHGRNSSLQLVCAAWWLPESPHMRKVFDAVDGEAAAWDLHVDSDAANAGASIDRRIDRMRDLFRQWNPSSRLKAVVFEENGNLHSQQRALGHATTLNATRRHGDFVLVDCPANCLQPWLQNDNGWDQGQLFFTPDHVWAMPPYYAQQMAAESYMPVRVHTAVTGGPGLDLIATRSEDGKSLVLSVVNTGRDPCSAELRVKGFDLAAAHGNASTLAGPLMAVNPPSGTETVSPVHSRVAGSGPYTFPAYSYTVIQWRAAGTP